MTIGGRWIAILLCFMEAAWMPVINKLRDGCC